MSPLSFPWKPKGGFSMVEHDTAFSIKWFHCSWAWTTAEREQGNQGNKLSHSDKMLGVCDVGWSLGRKLGREKRKEMRKTSSQETRKWAQIGPACLGVVFSSLKASSFLTESFASTCPWSLKCVLSPKTSVHSFCGVLCPDRDSAQSAVVVMSLPRCRDFYPSEF